MFNNKQKKFSPIVTESLKYYIYKDPRNNRIFYVGKGKGNRAFSHLNEVAANPKNIYIRELLDAGFEPVIEILVHGLENEEVALRVESSIIDLLGIHNLTNMNKGYKSSSMGRMSVEQVEAQYEREAVNIEEPSVLIRINQNFRYSLSPEELYGYTRGVWKVSRNTCKKANYAFSVYQGIIQEVYAIHSWHEAGTTRSHRDYNEENVENLKDRLEFVGEIASDKMRNKYLFKSVEHYFKKGNSNPIMYLNII